MSTTLTATATITLNASPARVWEALTNPAQIKQYLFGTTVTTDWQEGSPIIYAGEWEGKPYEDKGLIVKVEKEQLLHTKYWSAFSGLPDRPENYQDVIYSLSSTGATTTLEITQTNLPDEEKRAHSEKNWTMVLDLIKKIAEQ